MQDPYAKGFAPQQPAPPPQMPPGTAPCSSCGRPVNPAQASLSTATGLPICPMCVAGEGLQASQGRAVQSLAYGAFGTASLAWVLNFVVCGVLGIVFGIIAIVTGAQALNMLGKPDYQHTPNRGLLYAAAISGIVGGALVSVIYVLSVTLFAASRLVR